MLQPASVYPMPLGTFRRPLPPGNAVAGDESTAVSECRNFVPKQAFTRYFYYKSRFFVKRTAWWRKQVSRTVSDLTKSEEEVDALGGRLGVVAGLLRL